MNRIAELFKKKDRNILNVYCTAGYPQLNSTMKVLRSLQQHGADMIEIGMPYSDPLADGPVIQASSTVAIKNGMTITKLFEQLKDMRNAIRVPVVLMGYMNPVLQYGFERFCADAAKVGIDGLIIPDLPEFEFESNYASIIHKHHLDFIFLVTPETSEQRVKKLDSLSDGFLYAVSSSSITGTDKDMNAVDKYLDRLSGYGLKNPLLVGFGIRDRSSFKHACDHARGAIIGTAYIKALATGTDVDQATHEFLVSVKN